MTRTSEPREHPVVLVVDDDVANVRVATDALEYSGFEVVMARSGESALRRAGISYPDVILLDVTKPFEVEELLARVRAHASLHQLRQALQAQNLVLEARVEERTVELRAANQALRDEIVERAAQQQEKDKLLEVVRDQAEQLRTLTSWLLESQRDKQHAVAESLREESQQRLVQLEADIQQIQRVLLHEARVSPSATGVGASLNNASHLLAELKAGVSAASARLDDSPLQAELTLLRLSGREREILQLIAAGKSATEIASKMHISASTVYTHRTNMLEKLNLTTAAELLRFALETRDFFTHAS